MKVFYPAEIVKPGCTNETTFDVLTDPRFSKVGFKTNEYDVQLKSGVLNLL